MATDSPHGSNPLPRSALGCRCPPAGILLDVYETILTLDVPAVLQGLAETHGLGVDEWNRASSPYIPAAQVGSLTLEEAFARTLEATGRSREGAGALVAADLQLVLRHASVFPDVWPFLRACRERSIRVALISNCSENTRPLLQELGILDEVEAAVLSNEVGAVKPEPAIYLTALQRLDVSPHQALLIDDQLDYCQGALDLGIRAPHLPGQGRRPHPADAQLSTVARLRTPLATSAH